jgi:hypothetical protein
MIENMKKKQIAICCCIDDDPFFSSSVKVRQGARVRERVKRNRGEKGLEEKQVLSN